MYVCAQFRAAGRGLGSPRERKCSRGAVMAAGRPAGVADYLPEMVGVDAAAQPAGGVPA